MRLIQYRQLEEKDFICASFNSIHIFKSLQSISVSVNGRTSIFSIYYIRIMVTREPHNKCTIYELVSCRSSQGQFITCNKFLTIHKVLALFCIVTQHTTHSHLYLKRYSNSPSRGFFPLHIKPKHTSFQH